MVLSGALLDGYIWTVEDGFYFSLTELVPTVFGPFASMMMATEAASSIFEEQTAGIEAYGGAELNLIAVELPPAAEHTQDFSRKLRLHG